MIYTFFGFIIIVILVLVMMDFNRIASISFATPQATIISLGTFLSATMLFLVWLGWIKFDQSKVYQPILLTSFVVGCLSILFYMIGLVNTKRVIISLLSNAILLIFLFAFVYYQAGLSGEEIDFSTSLYFSIVTWTTLGYGDLHPDKAIRGVAAVQAMMGYIFMGFLVGSLANRR